VRGLKFAEHLKVEEHPKAEVWEAGMHDLRTAAQHGEVEGQYQFGITQFGFLFTDHAPEPADEKVYVDAIAFVRVAALRGHVRAKQALPGIAEVPLPDKFQQPLDAIPRRWLEAADKQASQWLECAPPELRTMPPSPLVTVLEANDSGWTRRGDPEGPLVRVIAGRRSSLTNQVVAMFPAVFDCYADFLKKSETKSHVALGLEIDAGSGAVKVKSGDDPELSSCIDRSLPLAPDDVSAFRFAFELHPRALDAPPLPDAEGETVERWEEDKSCWALERLPPCPKNKSCEGPRLIRVRCP
jgi:hypothetical protein